VVTSEGAAVNMRLLHSLPLNSASPLCRSGLREILKASECKDGMWNMLPDTCALELMT
jgi:hypothetical protein